MSLQGSFETIALRDVMALLASSSKSGELRVVGGHIEGRLWMHDGRLVGSKVGKSRDHVDAIFDLLRLPEGNFVFKDGVEAPEPGEPTAVEPVMREAEERLREWQDIQAVVPSLEHRVRLIPDLTTPEVTLSAHEWHLVMAVALAASVRGVLEELGLTQFEGCRGIRRLVDAGLVIVESPRVRPSLSDPARPTRRVGTTVSSPAASSPAPSSLASSSAPGRDSVVDLQRPAAAATATATTATTATTAKTVAFSHELSYLPQPIEYSHRYDDVAGDDMAGDDMAGDDMAGDDSDDFGNDHFADLDADIDAAHYANGVAASPRAYSFLPQSYDLGADGEADADADADALSEPAHSADRHERDPGADPINRGLLLKFLSSVRT